MHYTVTIYVAAPGTPLVSGGTSAAGHVYYVTSDGHSQNSFGFAPIEHGVSRGAGKPWDSDFREYQKPAYARTMQISEEQYNKLNQFGTQPPKYGFDMNYHGATNSCIDYTWAALNYADLHTHTLGFIERKEYEGSLKPLDNIRDLKFISAPYRDSPLNREQTNPMPDRTLFQRLISENEPQTLSPTAQTIKQQCHSHVHGFCERNNQKWTLGMDNTYMALTVVAREAQMSGVDALGVSQGTIYIAQTDHKGIYREAEINAHEAANIPMAQSEQRLAIIDQQMLVQEQQAINNPTQTQHKVQSGPKLG